LCLAAEDGEPQDIGAAVEPEGTGTRAGKAGPNSQRGADSRNKNPPRATGVTLSLFPPEGNDKGNDEPVGRATGKANGQRGGARRKKASPSKD